MILIYGMLIMFFGLMGVALYGWLHNRQVDKYNEWKKQQEAENAA